MSKASSILLLEADDLTVSHLSSILSKADFNVIAAASFQEAFQKIKKMGRDLALVILDFELATDDLAILERLRKLDFDRPLPVVLMGQVPLSTEEIQQLVNDSGYAGYLYKSMPEQHLMNSIATLTIQFGDRRKSRRVLYQTRVHCVFSERNVLAETYTINRNGAFIRMASDLPPRGTTGTISFNGSLEGKKLLTVQVEVVHARYPDPKVMSIYPPGIAVRFTGLSPEQFATLENLEDYQAERGKVYAEPESG